MTKFEGFPPEAVKFFRALRKNNTRDWFQPRKEIFDTRIREVMEQLVGLINTALGRFAPLHIAEPKKAIYRIYRDTRFSNDKTPYKTHIAANFPRLGMEKHSAAGYYFSVSDEEVEIAGGIYMPGPPELLAIRSRIADQHQRFGKIVQNKKVVGFLGPLAGTSLTRVPKGFDAAHPAADWIRMKQWMFYKTFPGALMTSPELLKTVDQGFRLVAPLVDFLNEPLIHAAKKPNADRMLD
jgi:uncharacterized protein (TIGR02453 family)